MGTNNKKIGVGDLLDNLGDSTERNIQKIKTVAGNGHPNQPDNDPEHGIAGNENQELPQNNSILVLGNNSEGFEYMFQRRRYDNLEIARIPSSLHNEMKIMASMTKTTITEILGNILTKHFTENKKEIDKAVEKTRKKLK